MHILIIMILIMIINQCVALNYKELLCFVHTRAGGVGFIFVIAAVIVAITQPSQWDTAVVLAFESVSWAGVLIWGKKTEKYTSILLF